MLRTPNAVMYAFVSYLYNFCKLWSTIKVHPKTMLSQIMSSFSNLYKITIPYIWLCYQHKSICTWDYQNKLLLLLLLPYHSQLAKRARLIRSIIRSIQLASRLIWQLSTPMIGTKYHDGPEWNILPVLGKWTDFPRIEKQETERLHS